MLALSDLAPDFTLPRADGDDVTLSSLRGTNVVLFFYPRDNTPGCTTESMDFSAAQQEFAAANTQIFGISRDSLASHAKFTAKRALSVPLLSDEHSNVCENYGVWKEKKMYGKVFMGIERTTVLITAEGRIAQVWRKVKVAGHVQEVLDAARAL